MPKWKKDETEFDVALHETSGSHICRIPKPIVEKFGIPSKIKFIIEGKKVIVKAGNK